MTPRVREILNWYGADNPGVLTNLARIMNHGKLAGTGKMVILPVDQGFEHGPARSFAKNPDGYDPNYHVELAIESGCNAYAAPLGFIEAIARDYAGEIPLILKINNSESLYGSKAPISAVTSYIDDALRLGCVGIGFTVYPGSAERKQMYEEIAEASRLAKQAGLVVVIWSYPRGEQLSKEGETAIDVIAYAAHIAAQLGAHIIKVKPPTAHIEQAAAAKVYAEQGIKVTTMADRIRHVVQSCFNGKRIVIFSGGEAKGTEELLKEVQEMGQGGGFGSIMGRNAFQRPKKESIALLHGVMEAFAGKKL
ncbi:class I fructose-bisphosphate aldolase [Bdellovibrio sp. ZAP7]|uniref:class I fructose-bisphosphate aldolase n=1 Tax=Bdellovibrio sp. ZAP7 TaxID=2231053 RepID=UPI00115AF6DC|nr:class I fructose-bisphosphate aldolase [Bdellovibrio sp. ZAP7]QDK45918.1 class I fructose-bisphosphate aldolase [Bdellovibrio sp. ZAP7]